MIKKSLLALLGICAAGGGIGTYAAKYSSGKDKSKGGVAVDSSEKDQQKNTKPAAAKAKDADPKPGNVSKPATTKPGVAQQNPPQPQDSGQVASKPGSQVRSNPQRVPGPAQAKPAEPKDFGKIPAKWELKEVLTDTYPSITVTASKENTVFWICVIRWKNNGSGMPDFTEIDKKSSKIKSKLVGDNPDVEARKLFIKNCTEGRLQEEKDIVVSSTDNEIFLVDDGGKGPKDLEKVCSEDLKDMVRLNKTSYEILIADDWKMEIGNLEETKNKNKKITFKANSDKWQCNVEAKNVSGELDADWKTKFENEVLKEKISETNFGNNKKILLKNCLDNNKTIKMEGKDADPLTKEKIRTSLLTKDYKNPANNVPKA